MRTVMESSKIKGHSYPCDSASRLGKAIKRVMDGGVGAKKGVFPLVELLKTHANTPAEFDTFLADSYVVTLPQERWPTVKSASGGEHFLCAMLESACKSGGVASDADAIAALEYDMDASALMAWLTKITSTPSQAQEAPCRHTALVPHQVPVASSSSGAINVMFHPQPAKASEQEKKEHEQLRDDAESLSKEQRSMALIESMRVVKASGDAEALARLTSSGQGRTRMLRLLNAISRPSHGDARRVR